MDHVEIAYRAGVTLDDLNLLLQGTATANVAARLGVTMADVEAFINGAADAAMTKRLGLHTTAAAVDLGTAAGRNGAIGVILGLLLSNAWSWHVMRDWLSGRRVAGGEGSPTPQVN